MDNGRLRLVYLLPIDPRRDADCFLWKPLMTGPLKCHQTTIRDIHPQPSPDSQAQSTGLLFWAKRRAIVQSYHGGLG